MLSSTMAVLESLKSGRPVPFFDPGIAFAALAAAEASVDLP